MNIVSAILNRLQPQREAQTLYVAIEEIPQPRDWGVIELSIGNKVLLSRQMCLIQPDNAEAMNWLQANLAKIQRCGYQKVVFKNVSAALEAKITKVLGWKSLGE